MTRPEIHHEPEISEVRRDRSERAVLARLAAIRAADPSDRAVPGPTPWSRWVAIGIAGAGLAAALALVIGREGTRAELSRTSPSLVVTPVGGSSRFTVDDSIIDVGSDTSVEVALDRDGGTTLQLARGTIDCEVSPRAGRPPFRVLAGEVAVEVVGTRFGVTRHGATVRVDVTRGKVRVTARDETRVLEAGHSWTSAAAGGDAPAPAPAAAEPSSATDLDELETPAVPDVQAEPEPRPKPARTSPRAAFGAANQLRSKSLEEAARAYRAIANGSDPVWAPLALYSLAELYADDLQRPAEALRALDELTRRFPRHANAEDAAWMRVGVLRRLGRGDEARRAAAAYLRAYPSGTFADHAARLAPP
jgi:TolA-binding protein